MHQRERQAFENHGDVVGMCEPAVRPRGHPSQPGHDDDARVPLPAQGRDAPPPQGLTGRDDRKHAHCKRGPERWIEQPHLRQRADQTVGLGELGAEVDAVGLFDHTMAG